MVEKARSANQKLTSYDLIPCNPADDQFVFSAEQIDLEIYRRDRWELAKSRKRRL